MPDYREKVAWGDAIVAARKMSEPQLRSLADLPSDVTPGVKEVCMLTAISRADEAALGPVVKALKFLEKLPESDWRGKFLVADEANFNWRTAPLRHYDSFQDFYERELSKTWGEWHDLLEEWQEVVGGTKTAVEACDRINRRVAKAKQAEVADSANPSRQGERTDLVYNKKNVIHKVRPSGTSTKAALRRLRKHRPDLHDRVLHGQMTVNAATIEAGFRKRRPRKPRTPLTKVQAIWQKATAEERQEIYNWCSQLWKNKNQVVPPGPSAGPACLTLSSPPNSANT